MKVKQIEQDIKNSMQLTVDDLKVGDIGVAEYEGSVYHILASYDGFVQLENPSNTYTQPCHIKLVKILKKGDSVILTIE